MSLKAVAQAIVNGVTTAIDMARARAKPANGLAAKFIGWPVDSSSCSPHDPPIPRQDGCDILTIQELLEHGDWTMAGEAGNLLLLLVLSRHPGQGMPARALSLQPQTSEGAYDVARREAADI